MKHNPNESPAQLFAAEKPEAKEHTIGVTFFHDKYAKSCRAEQMTLPMLADKIRSTAAGEKSRLPLLKMGIFGDKKSASASLRHDANVISISGVEMDYDGEKVSFDETKEILEKANLCSLLYTSPSHSEKKPRSRVILPTSKLLPPNERVKLAARANGMFGGHFAPESFTLSQAYYYGSVKSNPFHRVEINDGDFIDLRGDLDAGARDKNGKLIAIPTINKINDNQNYGTEQRKSQKLNAAALGFLDLWVPKLFPEARRRDDGSYRMSSRSLGRNLEEDLSITAKGIKDFGVHDMGDPREGRRSPLDLVMTYLGKDFVEAQSWLQERLREVLSEKGMNEGVSLDDFLAYMPTHQYIYVPTREPWPATSVNARLGQVPISDPAPDQNSAPKTIPASNWLDRHKPIEQMTWAPGYPELIKGRFIAEGGWIEKPEVTCFNLYRPPTIHPGNAAEASPWVDHVRKVYPDDADHIIKFAAHRVQHPEEKINHALVLGGKQGIGKDTLLEPVKQAVGPWNFSEVSPHHLLGRFNGYLKSTVLRVSEARDLGEMNRYQFYDHMKSYSAAPPDVLRVDEKNLREHSVLNCCGVIITTNHKTDGIYLPADDRRHYVAWSNLKKEDFSDDYWKSLWGWYQRVGFRHVAAYLKELDISSFDPKAPPPKTTAFWDIVDANRAPEDAELADVIDKLKNPRAITLCEISSGAEYNLGQWIDDRKNRRAIPHRLEQCGYTPVRNGGAKDGLWVIKGARQVIYAKSDLSVSERLKAASDLMKAASH